MYGTLAWSNALALVGRVKLATGRVPHHLPDEDHLLDPPDSAMARAAEEACAEQPDPLIGHGYRTWIYGRALATVDAAVVDPELFYVAALLHDAGLVEAVAGEDFTLRSGHVAARCLEEHGRSADDVWRMRDGISAHVTPGATLDADGPIGYFLQAGAVLDLAGLRACDLSSSLLGRVLARHPRRGLTAGIIGLIDAEAEAVPDGRFGVLCRAGFKTAIRLAPFDEK